MAGAIKSTRSGLSTFCPWLLQMRVLLAVMARKIEWTVDLDEPVSAFPLWKPLQVNIIGRLSVSYAPARLDRRAFRLCKLHCLEGVAMCKLL